MRFATQQHQFYGGIDVHARTMYVCILNQDGEILLHRHMKTSPETLLGTLHPIGLTSSSRSKACSPGPGSPTSALRKGFPLSWAMPST